MQLQCGLVLPVCSGVEQSASKQLPQSSGQKRRLTAEIRHTLQVLQNSYHNVFKDKNPLECLFLNLKLGEKRSEGWLRLTEKPCQAQKGKHVGKRQNKTEGEPEAEPKCKHKQGCRLIRMFKEAS